MMFKLQDCRSRPIALAEAADSADVELFAIREVSGFHRAVLVPALIDHGPGLEADFKRMGLSESAARIAAAGRDPGPGPILPLHHVPRQEARPVRSQAAASTPALVPQRRPRHD